jgi:hypothetical protein
MVSLYITDQILYKGLLIINIHNVQKYPSALLCP